MVGDGRPTGAFQAPVVVFLLPAGGPLRCFQEGVDAFGDAFSVCSPAAMAPLVMGATALAKSHDRIHEQCLTRQSPAVYGRLRENGRRHLAS